MRHARAAVVPAGARAGGAGGAFILAMALALAACGVSPAQQVQAKVQEYAHAVGGRDSGALCSHVLAPSLVAVLQARTGLSCREAMATYVDSVTGPTLSISKVTVKGAAATAVVLAGARGQQASLGAIHLVDTKAGWRVASLTQP